MNRINAFTSILGIYFVLFYFACSASATKKKIVPPGVEKSEIKLNTTKPHLPVSVIELNGRNEVKDFVGNNTKFMFEVYSPECSHCMIFAPIYEKLAEDLKATVRFARVNGDNPANYRWLVKVFGFPTVFLYDEGKFIEYKGMMQYEPVLKFISRNFDFTCTSIENPEELLKLNSKQFILGVFKNQPKRVEDLVKTFIKLNKDIRELIESCFYTINDNIIPFQEFTSDLHKNSSYILVSNGKHISTFPNINDSPSHESADLFEDFYKNYLSTFYSDFIKKNYYKDVDHFDIEKMSSYRLRERCTLVFTYMLSDKEETEHYTNLAQQFSAYNKLKFGYTVLLNGIQNELESSELGYFAFTQRAGIYLISKDFKDELYTRGEPFKNYTLQRLLEFIMKTRFYRDDFGVKIDYKSQYGKYSGDLDSKVKYVTATIKSPVSDKVAIEKEKKELEEALYKKSQSSDNEKKDEIEPKPTPGKKTKSETQVKVIGNAANSRVFNETETRSKETSSLQSLEQETKDIKYVADDKSKGTKKKKRMDKLRLIVFCIVTYTIIFWLVYHYLFKEKEEGKAN